MPYESEASDLKVIMRQNEGRSEAGGAIYKEGGTRGTYENTEDIGTES